MGKACFVLFPSFADLDLYLFYIYLGPTFFSFIISFVYFPFPPISPEGPASKAIGGGSMAFQKLGHFIMARMIMFVMTAVMTTTNSGVIQHGGGKKVPFYDYFSKQKLESRVYRPEISQSDMGHYI